MIVDGTVLAGGGGGDGGSGTSGGAGGGAGGMIARSTPSAVSQIGSAAAILSADGGGGGQGARVGERKARKRLGCGVADCRRGQRHERGGGRSPAAAARSRRRACRRRDSRAARHRLQAVAAAAPPDSLVVTWGAVTNAGQVSPPVVFALAGDAVAASTAIGTATVNSVPVPCCDDTEMRPPARSMTCRARAFLRGLGGEVRIEDHRQVPGGNADAVVLGDQHRLAGAGGELDRELGDPGGRGVPRRAWLRRHS